ncbi:hypothetical protein IMSAG049_00488 [Clostridiales bacterium]|nr:hypothetical protein IMSAG049_00488 [Clostridiales bacterium]
MKKHAILFIAAVMSMGTATSALAEGTFADINDVPWSGAQAYINSALENRLMIGEVNANGERVFRAREQISYNETVQLVYTLSSQSVTEEAINKWAEDMKNNNIPRWAYNSVAYCLENSIITRTDIAAFMNYDGTARSVTREDAAYIFGRFLAKEGFSEKPGKGIFADMNKISAVCQPYATMLASLDIIVGDENNNFNPNSPINRAEMAVIATKTNTLIKEKTFEQLDDVKPKPDYSGYINNVTPTSLMLYTFDGKNVILDRAHNSQYYLDGKEIDTRGIYSLTSNGILVRADVYVNSSDIAMEIYCSREDAGGRISGLGYKDGEYKRGSRIVDYAFNTVTITYANGLSRSYRVDDDTAFYYDDKEIDELEFQELIGKSFSNVPEDSNFEIYKPDDDDKEKYLSVYGTAEVEYNDEYSVYPQARIKELHLYTILLEEAVISYINSEKIVVLDEDGREFEYNIDDDARFYVDGKKKRINDFKKAVRLNFSTVTIDYDNDGYVTKLEAETE